MTESTAIEDLLAAADDLDARLASDPSPAAVTASAGGSSLTVNADGLLSDAVTGPVASPAEATRTLNALLVAAGEALVDPDAPAPSGIHLQRHHDPRRPHPSILDRVGAGTSDGFSWATVHRALADVRGEGRTPHATVVALPGGAPESITVTALPEDADELAAAVLVAARLAAGDAAAAVRARVSEGGLDPAWAVTQMLSTDPYQER